MEILKRIKNSGILYFVGLPMVALVILFGLFLDTDEDLETEEQL
jgi:hypothetical protein